MEPKPGLELPDVEPGWTPRQRQVLDLLVEGRTNGEIGERLGIGLEGVKWHVSEILSKLGVESRDEAAEYWRHRNGLRMRFLRLAGGATTAFNLRWLAAGAGVAAVIAIVAVALILLSGDGGSVPVAPLPSPSASAGATPTPSTSTPSASPTPSITEVVATVLQPGMRGLIGYDSVAYYSISCSGCDGGGINLFRAAYADSTLVEEELLPGSSGLAAESIYTFAADFERGEMYAAACIQGYCGQLSEASGDAQNVLLHSTDGGVTWRDAGALPANAILVGLLSDGRALARNAPAGREHFFLDGGAPPVPFDGFDGFAFIDASGALFWRDAAGEHLYDEAGAEIVFNLPGSAQFPTIFDRAGGGDLWAAWHSQDATVFGRFEPGQARGEWDLVESWMSSDVPVQLVHLMPGLGSVAVIARYEEEPCVLLGCPEPDPRRPAVEAAIINLGAGTIHPIPELSERLSGNEHPFIHALTANLPYLTVNAPDDCLNLRDGASAAAPIVDCVADRVLVRSNGVPEDADGTRWQPVLLFDGREGWVVQEFLLRQHR